MAMTRWLLIAALVLGTGSVWTGAAVAATAAIVTVAPIGDDQTEEAVKSAAAVALSRAVRGAQAMGLDNVMLKSIRVVPGTGVVVEVVATDSEGSEPSLLEVNRPPKPTL